MTAKGRQGLAAASPLPPGPRPLEGRQGAGKVGRLHDVPSCRRELARIYREARAGRLPWREAAQAAHVLDTLRRMLEAEAGAPALPLAEVLARLEARLPPAEFATLARELRGIPGAVSPDAQVAAVVELLSQALAPFPEARAAVAGALEARP